jgi:CheY-like chemotaxis protein
MTRVDGRAALPLLKGFFGSLPDSSLNGALEVKPLRQDLPAKGSTQTVLVIDDDKKFLGIVCDRLLGTGFGVLTCTSGAKGLDMMRYCRDDLQVMLLDYRMPRLDEAETLQHARRLNRQIKVIDVDIDKLPISFRDGVQGFVTKPVSGTNLNEIVNTLRKDSLGQPVSGPSVLCAAGMEDYLS